MPVNSFESTIYDVAETESNVDVEQLAGEVRSGLESLQKKWETVSTRDDIFLYEAGGILTEGCKDENNKYDMREFMRRRREDLQEHNSPDSGGPMFRVSAKSIGECNSLFLDKVVNSSSTEEVSAYATEMLNRISGLFNDVQENRNVVKNIRGLVVKESYEKFEYAGNGAIEKIDDLSQKELRKDESFIGEFKNTVRNVKQAVNTLAEARLRRLQNIE
jgi:hypothetical protein